MEEHLTVGDLVVPSRAAESFNKRHGFGILMEINTRRDQLGAKFCTVKFTKSRAILVFTPDALRRYE